MVRPTGFSAAVLLLTVFSFSPACARAGAPPGKTNDAQLQAQLAIIRYVDGEYAKVVQPLPAKKKGFRYKVGQKIDANKLRMALAYGSAANPGDQVQVTNIEFRTKEIIVSINGGTKGHFDWRKHIQIGIGGGPMMGSTPIDRRPTPIGAELILDFNTGVGQLTPEQVKQALSPFLSFAVQHSAAVNWIDTLPPDIQQAIKNHEAKVGMNQDMVLAALGRPDKKVREYDDNGHETEDWIYGLPPEKSTLVTFLGNKVIRIKSYGG
jgi:hypothetical protein